MATKLKNMKLTSVDLVKAGANQKADICLHKSATPQEAAEATTEAEKNIFKRFIGWLRENRSELDDEPENPIEKGDTPEPAEIYKSAITESIQSIIADESLSAEEKNDMVAKSLGQYHDKMMELAKAEPHEEPEGEQEQLPDPEDDPEDTDEPEYEDIEEVEDPVKKK